MRTNVKAVKRSSFSNFVVLPDGRKLPMMGNPCVRYDAKLDISSGDIICWRDKDYDASPLPTINELISDGTLSEGSFLRKHEISFSDEESCAFKDEVLCGRPLSLDFDALIAEFAAHGLKVSRRALEHNFFSWVYDFKSGYRCKRCYLFTPCGCNPLSFTATSLSKYCNEWQTTYWA